MKYFVLFLLLISSFSWAEDTFSTEDISVKSAACAPCHGASGESTQSVWPNLAGQHANYLLKQLRDFKDGKKRYAAEMAPFVSNLTEEDMKNLAAFFSKKSLPIASSNTAHAKEVDHGRQLYRAGDAKKQITACIACHGPSAKGNALAGFPVLAGQKYAYSLKQLKAFKSKKRSNDANSIMRMITSHMSLADMKAVARYLESVK